MYYCEVAVCSLFECGHGSEVVFFSLLKTVGLLILRLKIARRWLEKVRWAAYCGPHKPELNFYFYVKSDSYKFNAGESATARGRSARHVWWTLVRLVGQRCPGAYVFARMKGNDQTK